MFTALFKDFSLYKFVRTHNHNTRMIFCALFIHFILRKSLETYKGSNKHKNHVGTQSPKFSVVPTFILIQKIYSPCIILITLLLKCLVTSPFIWYVYYMKNIFLAWFLLGSWASFLIVPRLVVKTLYSHYHENDAVG